MAAEYATPLRLTVESRAELDTFVFQLMNAAKRRVTLSDAIAVACKVAAAHLPEAQEVLTADPKTGEGDTRPE